MPKRAETPPPPGDTRYLTVVSPYPPNPNWDLPADRVLFARWMACALGGYEQFFAFYHKPKSRGMVIVEIDSEYTDFRRVLGEHHWANFLKAPTPEDKGRKTQVYHCFYTSDRKAQKDGWLRKDIEEDWFAPGKWTLNNQLIKNPYPMTYWCPLPPDSQTHKNLCRPIPVGEFPPAPTDDSQASESTDRASNSSGAAQQQRSTNNRNPAPAQTAPRRNVPWNNPQPNMNSPDALPNMRQILPSRAGSSAGSKNSASVTESLGGMSIDSYDDDDDDDEEDGLPLASNVVEELPESIRASIKLSEPVEPKALCPVHGILCVKFKGICQEVSNQKREQARAKEKAEREEAKQKALERRKAKSERKGKVVDEPEPGDFDLGAVDDSEDEESSGRDSPLPSTQDKDGKASGKGKQVVKQEDPWDVAEDDEF